MSKYIDRQLKTPAQSFFLFGPRGTGKTTWVNHQFPKAYRDYDDLFDEFYYWSPASSRNTEVDFLLKRENSFIAVEVKTSPRITAVHLKGLRAIAELKGIKRRIMIYPGEKKMQTEDHIDIWPFDFFCEILGGKELWEASK